MMSGLLAAVVMMVALFGAAMAQPVPPPTPRAAITGTVTLEPAQDNTLFSESGNISNGAGEYLFAGSIQRGDLRRAVVGFDLAGIPRGATVLTATLTLTMSRSIAGETPVMVHTLQQAWGEGDSDALGEEGAGAAAAANDATWLHTFFNTSQWTTPGGDFEAAPVATTAVGGNGAYRWTSADLVANVQAWVADPAANFGWILLGDETTPTTAKRFDSRENEPGNRPTLVVVYEVYATYAPVVVGE